MSDKPWFVYILECSDGSYYTGVTNDVEKRMKIHKSGKGSKYVRTKGFRHLIATKLCENRSDACKEECRIKELPRDEKIFAFK